MIMQLSKLDFNQTYKKFIEINSLYLIQKMKHLMVKHLMCAFFLKL